MYNHKFLQNTNVRLQTQSVRVRSACVSSPSSPVPDDVLRGTTRSPHTGSPGLPPVSWFPIVDLSDCCCHWLLICSSLLSDHHWGLDWGAGTYIEAVMSQQPVGFRPARGGTWCWFVVAGNWICFYCNLPNRPFNNSNGNHWNKNITLIQKVDNNTVVFTKSPFEICSPKSIICFQIYSCFILKHLH